MTLMEILTRLARPRPNHSDALDAAAAFIGDLLRGWDVPFIVQEYPLRHHMFAVVGIACLALTVLLLVLVVKKNGCRRSSLPWRCRSSWCWSSSSGSRRYRPCS
jgi:hypothetical protein